MGAMGEELPYTIGTMIELPRAALTADEIATAADFFSFGTNDLTQTTLGLSRDNAGRFLPMYVEAGIYPEDPFRVLDVAGVGKLDQVRGHGRAPRAPEHEDGHLRGAWRRAPLDRLLPDGRTQLRLVLSLPCADRAVGGGAGGAQPSQVKSSSASPPTPVG